MLDLDETLVSAYESSSLPAIVRTQAVEAGLHCFDMECLSTEKVQNLCFWLLLYVMILITTAKGSFACVNCKGC